MAGRTSIQWATDSWNPVRGCSRISPGCGGPNHQGGCYAEKIAARFSDPGQAFHEYARRTPHGGAWTGKMGLIDEALAIPLRWKRPRRIFVNSMSDLFHENLPDEAIDQIFAIMALAPQHTFMVLTKRSARMRAYMNDPGTPRRIARVILDMLIDGTIKASNDNWPVKTIGDVDSPDDVTLYHWPLSQIWLGVSCEDQQRADERVPDLLATPAAIRFVSAEPLLGPIDFLRWLAIDWQCSYCKGFFTGKHRPSCPDCGGEGGWTGSHAFNGRGFSQRDAFPIDRGRGLDLIIVGGESGPKSRDCWVPNIRSIVQQCSQTGVACFVKQLGAKPHDVAINGDEPLKLRDRKGGDMSEWPEDFRVRQLPDPDAARAHLHITHQKD